METKGTVELSDERKAARALLSALWRSLDFDRFDKRNIWGIFERKIRSASTQNIQLAPFFEQAKRKLSIAEFSTYITEKELNAVTNILQAGNLSILKEIRENTSLCVLLVRLEQQQKQEEYKAKKEKNSNEEDYV